MPKQLIIEACLINYGDDRGGVDHAAGTIVEVPKGTAIDLARAGRTLYVEKKDDPDKAGRHTASPEMLKAAADMRKTRDKATAAPEKADGDGNTQA
ncbi:MAG: hypothetical protein Q8N17_11765 [Burkholderiaceae bacterium]|nr:hypothetical protein [Burkholderiaceae bacterium]